MKAVNFRFVVPEGVRNKACELLAEEGGRPTQEGTYEPDEEDFDILDDAGAEPLTIVASAFAISMVTPVIVQAINDLRFTGGRIVRFCGDDIQEIVVPSANPGDLWIDVDGDIEHFPADRKNQAIEKIEETMAGLRKAPGAA